MVVVRTMRLNNRFHQRPASAHSGAVLTGNFSLMG
jgi:hypothetical protein